MSNGREEVSKMYYTQLIIVLSLTLLFFALLGVSIISLFQTEQAFQPMNDPNIVILGIAVGNYVSILFALIAQYTQNAALYIGKHFCKGEIVFKGEIPFFGEIEIVDKKIADTAFWVSAFIDALTNVVWFYRSVESPPDMVLKVMLNIIGYAAMIGSVFAEEAMGVILDALRKARKQFSDIKKQEKRMKDREVTEQNKVSYAADSSKNSKEQYYSDNNRNQEIERKAYNGQNFNRNTSGISGTK